MPDDVKNKIAQLEKELNSKDFKPRATEDILTRNEKLTAPTWDRQADAMSLLNEQVLQEARHKKMIKFVKISISFFVVAVLITGFIWWRGTNVISGENITIDISSPVEVAGGEPFETKFLVTNKNQVSIEAATLFVEYPAGFYSVSNKSALPRISKDLGVITPGQSISEDVNAILYGEQNTSKEVTVTLEYRLTGSNAVLRKVAKYAIKISSSPVNVRLSLLKEASSGQSVDFIINLDSNSKDQLNALLVQASYPSGFNFINSEPAPSYGTNTWVVSSLKPQEQRSIKIYGTIEGLENEEKITRIMIGTQNETDQRIIGTIYNSASESVVIKKPFVGLDIAVDGDRSLEHAVPLGRAVRADVFWQSNNPTKITDAVIEVKLKGGALNRYQIYASGGGFYRSVDDTIVWDKTGAPELGNIEPGARGSVSFGFSPVALGLDSGRVLKNPQITLEARVRARRASDVNVPEEISTFASRNVKFETDMRLTARGLYFTGPFTNSGPMPPKVEKETTYTIALSLRNSSNDISSVQAKTTLPIYVKWLGKVSPSGEDVSYDESSKQVTWTIGRVPAGGARDVAFQISFLPSLSQARQVPNITGQVSLTGTDDFTKTAVNDSKPPISTALYTDPSFVQQQASVVN